MSKQITKFSVDYIINHLNRYVVGQEAAKEALAQAGFFQIMRRKADETAYEQYIDSLLDEEFDGNQSAISYQATLNANKQFELVVHERDSEIARSSLKSRHPFLRYVENNSPAISARNTLVSGPSGCGKTYLITLLAKILNVPLIQIDASALTSSGYVGNSFAEVLEEQVSAYIRSSDDKDAAIDIKYAIIFLDEFDKLCKIGRKYDGSIHTQVQYELLKPIEGHVLRVGSQGKGGELNTSRFMWIFGGSFQHMRDEKSSSEKGMGYTGQVEVDPTIVHKYTVEDLQRAGVIRELAGRVASISEVSSLTREQLRDAMFKVDQSVMADYETLFSLFDKPCEVTPEEVELILDECMKLNLGARGLRTAIADVMAPKIRELEYEVHG